ncbi:TPA: phenylalanine--tRNA ligase subunit alpha [Candidatus Spyradomonas excrementavium]|nr:phenylalanine--tRNA ligase subunit alpha [Candidatus Spyradomonas excrementavium]
MQQTIENIRKKALESIENAVSCDNIEEIRVEFLSRKSELNNIKKNLKDLSNEEKRIIGPLANKVTTEIETHLNEKYQALYQKELNAKLEKEQIDVTLPGSYAPYGKTHLLTQTVNEIVEIFNGMGFSLVHNENSPEVETEYFNFDMLNIPADHPARDVQDTFFTNVAPNVVLRSQTSGAQIHEMLTSKPPIRVVAPGRVYRNESVSARKNNLFHQIEGLLVDKDITFGDLKGVMNEFIRIYFGSARPTRFRNSFFPFTEPSAEIDVQCIMCNGKGCRVCSGSGWLEILGAGMVDPNVLRNVGIDPDIYSGFAFGMGVERLAMLKWAVDDIRLFFNNDKRFLKQF